MKQPNERMYSAAAQVLNENATYSTVAKRFAVSPSTIRNWTEKVVDFERYQLHTGGQK
jgi:transposase-like protein